MSPAPAIRKDRAPNDALSATAPTTKGEAK